MDEPITHLVINYINIDEKVILVGATDNERWRWDTEEGLSGVNAKTIVYVTLTNNGERYSVSEEAGFHCMPGELVRVVAMAYIYDLFEIAWAIKNENLQLDEAYDRYFGQKICKVSN